MAINTVVGKIVSGISIGEDGEAMIFFEGGGWIELKKTGEISYATDE
jgi:hypothetical protein